MSDFDDLICQPVPCDRLPEGDEMLDLELPFDDPLGDHDLVSVARLAAFVQEEERES